MNGSNGLPPAGDPSQGKTPMPGDYSAPGRAEQAPVPPEAPAAAATPQPGPGTTQYQQPPVATPPQAAAPPPAQPPGAYAGQGGAMPPAAPMPPAPPRKQKKERGGGWRLWLVAIISGVIAALLILLLMPAIFGVNPYDLVRGKVSTQKTTGGKTTGSSSAKVVSPTGGASDVSGVARKVTPSVVNIDVRSGASSNPFTLQTPQEGTGSGVIYKSDGYIITNNHVVTGAQDITVTLASGEELKGKKVGADPENDIAVVKIDKSGLPAIDIGDSDNLVVGQLVVAVGSPLGFEQTVTSGIVSALHRAVGVSESGSTTTILTDLIQTDAPINPGNSGGALCDGSARLIGINTLIASQTGGSQGLGFAIPINTAVLLADDIIAGKPISHPYIGVLGQTVTPSVAQQYNLPVEEGAYVTQVVPGSPAEKAGIKTGDIIVGIDGKPVKSMDDVVAAVRTHQVGDKVTVSFYQGTAKKSAQVTLAEKPTTVQQQ
jgi:S1-C subfamily serine protease